MIYIEIELKKKVDWWIVLIKNKEDKTKYAKADISDNFNFFRQNIGIGLAPNAYRANRNIVRSTKAVRDKDSVGKTIYFEKNKSRSENKEGANASRKLDSIQLRLKGDI